MSGVTLRGYRPGDAAGIVGSWNASVGRDPVDLDRFCDDVLLDPNFDPAGLIVTCSGGEIVGAAYAVRRLVPVIGTDLESDTGWVPFFFLDPAERGHGIGRRLLGAALEFLQKSGVAQVDFACYTPNYFLPGIDPECYPAGTATLRSAGFVTRYSPVAMDRPLRDVATPADVRALEQQRATDGYRISHPAREEIREVISFVAAEFAVDWGEAIRDFALRGRDLRQILVLRDRAQQIVGFCMYGAYRGIRERFGPFGVAETLRGTGLGKILLYRCLRQMQATGLHNAWFLWTGEESPAGHLYRRAGFTFTRSFDVMRAVL